MSRCRNCGVTEHLTKECKGYGPWFPEEGKTHRDYVEEKNRIDALVAGDILAEHEESHAHD